MRLMYLLQHLFPEPGSVWDFAVFAVALLVLADFADLAVFADLSVFVELAVLVVFVVYAPDMHFAHDQID
jgi:hypothetical protein